MKLPESTTQPPPYKKTTLENLNNHILTYLNSKFYWLSSWWFLAIHIFSTIVFLIYFCRIISKDSSTCGALCLYSYFAIFVLLVNIYLFFNCDSIAVYAGFWIAVILCPVVVPNLGCIVKTCMCCFGSKKNNGNATSS